MIPLPPPRAPRYAIRALAVGESIGIAPQHARSVRTQCSRFNATGEARYVVRMPDPPQGGFKYRVWRVK